MTQGKLASSRRCIMTRAQAIKKFFNTEGYPEVKNTELIAIGKAHPDTLREIGDLCLAALGETLTVAN